MKNKAEVINEFRTIRLDGKITLLSALSHIGESLGTDSYLSEDIIIGPDGQPVECFLYSGNSFRGILRDMAAKYLLDKLGGVAIPLDTFHLLFSGGSIGGPQAVDIDQARAYRKALPALSIFGGGVGNQIMEGKLKIGAMYPLVKECQRVIPEKYRDEKAPSWKKWTYEKSYTRRDDSKQENMRKYIADAELLPGPKQQGLLTGETEAPKKKKEKDAPATQMRYTVELLAAGAIMYQRIYLQDMSDLELGAFVSALHEFQKAPFLGGKSGTGHGLCEIEYEWSYPGDKEPRGVFLRVAENVMYLSHPAEEAKQEYDDYLQKVYDGYLEDKAPELKQLLAGEKK
jgi:CRISPR type IV-associated protein Csf2